MRARLALFGLVSALAASCSARVAPKQGNAPLDVVLPESEKHLDLGRPGAPKTAAKSALLSLLERELGRNWELLRKQSTAPYFLSYEAIEGHSLSVEASFGALVESSRDDERSLDVDVRVGSATLDNTHRLRGDFDASRDFTRSEWLPLENDEGALVSVAWLATSAEYRRALEELVRVRANKQVKVDEEDDSADFSAESPSTFHEAPATLEADAARWEDRVRRWSSRFASHPEILESKIGFQAGAETRYVASTEGASLQIARRHVRIEIAASTVAPDGMRLERLETIDAPEEGALPAEAAVLSRVDHVISDLAALRAAPVVEPFAGPAILDGRAAAVFFHEIFGHRVEGHRQKDEEEGQTFSHKVGEPVMPAFLDVFDDPSVDALNGVPLSGYYPFDDEGIRGVRAKLVDRGVLSGFLMSRSPIRGFSHSNGHGRRERGHRVVSRQANLIVDPGRTTSKEALKQRLVEELRRDGRPYGLRFHEITGGYTNTSRYGSQAFKVLPVMVYRIYPDGREELVRGVDLEGTPLAALGRIEAAANDFEVFNGVCGAESGWVPVSAVSPSILVSQIEITRQEKGHDRPPLLPAPAALRRSP